MLVAFEKDKISLNDAVLRHVRQIFAFGLIVSLLNVWIIDH